MAKLLYSSNVPFDLSPWKGKDLIRVFAGNGCVMAKTREGEILQAVADPAIAARTEAWTRIQDIAISQNTPAVALGLVEDGTCLIAKRPLRRLFDRTPHYFHTVNEAVKSWRNIRQVAASDALFALDTQGKVHHVSLIPHMDDYELVEDWVNVRRIVPGGQNALFGITGSGEVLCAGSNCLRGPHGDLRDKLQGITGVRELYATGSECEKLTLIFRDGRVVTFGGETHPTPAGESFAASHPLLGVWKDRQDHLHFDTYLGETPCRSLGKHPVTDFAVGCCQWEDPFVLALAEHRPFLGLF